METYKRCPKCKVFMERSSGCNHMTCKMCNHQFCYMCKGPWAEHGERTGGHYRCNIFEKAQKEQKTQVDFEGYTAEERAKLKLNKDMLARFETTSAKMRMQDDAIESAQAKLRATVALAAENGLTIEVPPGLLEFRDRDRGGDKEREQARGRGRRLGRDRQGAAPAARPPARQEEPGQMGAGVGLARAAGGAGSAAAPSAAPPAAGRPRWLASGVPDAHELEDLGSVDTSDSVSSDGADEEGKDEPAAPGIRERLPSFIAEQVAEWAALLHSTIVEAVQLAPSFLVGLGGAATAVAAAAPAAAAPARAGPHNAAALAAALPPVPLAGGLPRATSLGAGGPDALEYVRRQYHGKLLAVAAALEALIQFHHLEKWCYVHLMYMRDDTPRQLLLFKQATLETHASGLFAMLEPEPQRLAKLDVLALRRYTKAVKKFAANLLDEVEYEAAFASAPQSAAADVAPAAARSLTGGAGTRAPAAGGAGGPAP
jgi:hypothetical protein